MLACEGGVWASNLLLSRPPGKKPSAKVGGGSRCSHSSVEGSRESRRAERIDGETMAHSDEVFVPYPLLEYPTRWG